MGWRAGSYSKMSVVSRGCAGLTHMPVGLVGDLETISSVCFAGEGKQAGIQECRVRLPGRSALFLPSLTLPSASIQRIPRPAVWLFLN